MAAADIGLIGAVLGAFTAILGTTLSDLRRARNEDRIWRRDRVVTAYEETLRYLTRSASRRSGLVFSPTGALATLSGDHVREWFDDLTEARHWMGILTTRCRADLVAPITEAAEALDSSCALLDTGTGLEARRSTLDGWYFCRVIRPTNTVGIEPTMAVIQRALRVVTACARAELGHAPAPRALTAGQSHAPQCEGDEQHRYSGDRPATPVGSSATEAVQ
jgi:hypothetical protein